MQFTSYLRRILVAVALLASCVVGGFYFYSRHKLQDALRRLPDKIGVSIQQTAQGFSFSKSDRGRTLFKVEASKAVAFKQGGLTELHNVQITVYGRDSARFDQISGDMFDYDPSSGDITANGNVQIDLQANPAGAQGKDQSSPLHPGSTLHLKTSGIVFNQKTGNAATAQEVFLETPQAKGSALGMSYLSNSNELTLQSQVRLTMGGKTAGTLTASHGVIRSEPHAIFLDQATLQSEDDHIRADQATIALRPDDTVEQITAEGNIRAESTGASPATADAEHLLAFVSKSGDQVERAEFSGNVHFQSLTPGQGKGSADRVLMGFSHDNIVKKIHAEGNVKLVRASQSSDRPPQGQDMEVTAPSLDALVADGRRMTSAHAPPGSQIVIRSPTTRQQTVITADQFDAKFDPLGTMQSLRGAPNARIVTQNPAQPNRVSTSDALDINFTPGAGVASILQEGHVAYHDDLHQAFAGKARYVPSTQLLLMTDSPRVTDGTMTTTADQILMDRVTGVATAGGEVKSSYENLGTDADGALFSSASPIHVTSEKMVATNSSSVATYSGAARIWQDANLIQASTLTFDRKKRRITAASGKNHPVSTVLFEQQAGHAPRPVLMTSDRLTYSDPERLAVFQDDVKAKGEDLDLSANRMQVHFTSGQGNDNAGGGKLDQIVANGNVVIVQGGRRGTGDQLTYTSAENKYVLLGGPPSIFDAERGNVTGDSLTFYGQTATVIVEGEKSSPVITRTTVAR